MCDIQDDTTFIITGLNEFQLTQLVDCLLDAVEIDGAFLKPTCSFGIVVYEATPDRPDPEPDALIAQSDKALYRAKLNGRDRYEIIHPASVDYERPVLPSPASSRLDL